MLAAQQNKMEEWVANGSTLAWLINPEEQKTTVYFNGTKKAVAFHEMLSGSNVLVGFEMQLNLLLKA